MTKHIKGILAMPSFLHHIDEMLSRVEVNPITPDCSEYEVRYRQGRQLVHDSLLALSRDPETTFDSDFVDTFRKGFEAPTVNLETPVATLMYWSGVFFALEQLKDYKNGIGD